MTAYTLAFGSLLLPGGKLVDLLGQKVTFLAGLIGFAGISVIGGASVNFGMLLTARAGQGAIAAYLATHPTSTQLTGRQTLTESALAHGYDTAFWWIAAGALIAGALLLRGPLIPTSTPSQTVDEVPTTQAK